MFIVISSRLNAGNWLLYFDYLGESGQEKGVCSSYILQKRKGDGPRFMVSAIGRERTFSYLKFNNSQTSAPDPKRTFIDL